MQAGQHRSQAQIALFIVGNGGHDLFVSGMIASLFQLLGQICQLIGMGGIVAGHILHQCSQLLHRGMFALGSAAATLVVTVVAVGVFAALCVEVVVGVGMLVAVFVGVTVAVGVCYAVVGMFMGMLMSMLMGVFMAVFVINVHKKTLLCCFFFIISAIERKVKTFISAVIPWGDLRTAKK